MHVQSLLRLNCANSKIQSPNHPENVILVNHLSYCFPVHNWRVSVKNAKIGNTISVMVCNDFACS